MQVSSVLAWVAILVCVSQVVLVGASAVASSASTQPSHGSSMPDITETPHGSERAASGAEASHKVELEGSKRAGATNDASQPDGAVVRDHADQPTGRAHDTKADESFRAKPRTLRRRQRNKWPVPTPAPHVVFASIALRGHITPLLRMAREMVVRGYRVTVATNPRGSIWVNSTGAEVQYAVHVGPRVLCRLTPRCFAVRISRVSSCCTHRSSKCAQPIITRSKHLSWRVGAAWTPVPACRRCFL